MILTNFEGYTELYSLESGPRISLTMDPDNNRVTITAAVQESGGPGTGTGIVDFGKVDNGKQKAVTFNIDGVEMNNIILASVDVDLQELIISAYTKAPDGLEVVLFNGGKDPKDIGIIEVAIANFGKP